MQIKVSFIVEIEIHTQNFKNDVPLFSIVVLGSLHNVNANRGRKCSMQEFVEVWSNMKIEIPHSHILTSATANAYKKGGCSC